MRRLRLLALVCILSISFIALSTLIFTRQGGAPGDSVDFENDLRDVIDDLAVSYILPDNAAAAGLHSDCRDSLGDSSIASCREFVETVRRLNPILKDLMERLKVVLSNAPANADANAVTEAQDILNRFTVVHQANLLLLAGWNSRDASKWSRGLDLRERLNRR